MLSVTFPLIFAFYKFPEETNVFHCSTSKPIFGSAIAGAKNKILKTPIILNVKTIGKNTANDFPTAGGTPAGNWIYSFFIFPNQTNSSVVAIPIIKAVNNPFESIKNETCPILAIINPAKDAKPAITGDL